MKLAGEDVKRTTSYQGIPVNIEYDKNEKRTWDWSGVTVTYPAAYGYVPDTVSDDDEEIDVFMVSKQKKPVYMVEKNREKVTGEPDKGWEFDEHKYYLGAKNKKEVESLFRRQFDRPQLMGNITKLPLPHFKKLIDEQTSKTSEDFRYKLQGKQKYQGIPVSIENRKGSVRKGVDNDGKSWRTKMLAHYGRIPRIMGADGDALDVFLASHKSTPVFIVHQKDKKTGRFDEDKVILGVQTKDEARKLFLKHYDSPEYLGSISQLTLDEFKSILKQYRDKKISKITKSKVNTMEKKAISSLAHHILTKMAEENTNYNYDSVQNYIDPAEAWNMGYYDPGVYSPTTMQQMQQFAPRLTGDEFQSHYRQDYGDLPVAGGAMGGILGSGVGLAGAGALTGGKTLPMLLAGGLGALLGGYGGYRMGKSRKANLETQDKAQLGRVYKALSGQEGV